MMQWKYFKNELPFESGEYIIYAAGIAIAHYNATARIWELPSGIPVRAESGIVTHWFKPEVPEKGR